MNRRVLFLTHAGDAGGAEFMMMAIAAGIGERARVVSLQRGTLQEALSERGISHGVVEMPRSLGHVRRSGSGLAALRSAFALGPVAKGLVAEASAASVVVCFSQKSFLLAALVKPAFRRPVVWFMNDLLSREHFGILQLGAIISFSRAAADHVVLNSNASLNAWNRCGGRRTRVSVIYPGVDEQLIAKRLANRVAIREFRFRFGGEFRPLLGMFGRLSDWKGQDVFIRALAQVPGASAIIVGGSFFGQEGYELKIRQLATSLGLDARLKFLGHLGDPVTAMAACDIVVHCSRKPEPFGLVIVESMMAGIPVVASDGGGAREIIEDGETGQLSPVDDPDALALAIRRYLDNPVWAATVASRGRVFAHRFSVASMVHSAARLIEGLGVAR